MKNIFKKTFILFSLLAYILVCQAETISFLTTAQVSPNEGSIEYYPKFKSSNATDKGYKYSSDNDYIAWTLETSTFAEASFSFWINSNKTTYTIGYALSADKGKTWGKTYEAYSDGKKKEMLFSVPTANIPSGANAIKIIRLAGTATYLCSITLNTGTIPSQKSTDATLKELKYDGTSVAGFDAGKLDYSVVLPANYSGVPTITAIANDNNASVKYSQAASATGKASVLVTAEDGTTKKTYTIQFSQAVADEPVITSFTVAGVQAMIDQANKTITATLPIGRSLQGLTPTLSGDNIDSYTPQGAQDFSKSVQYTVKSKSGKTATYTVTLQVEQPKSSDATLKTLTVGGKSITLQAGKYSYTVDVESGSAVPKVEAEVNDSKAKAVVTQATSLTDQATIVVTAEDGSTQTYTITFNVKVPSSDLSIHTPGIYEAEQIAGGYGGTLSVFGGREYEVYYAGKDGDGNTTINLTPAEKNAGIAINRTSTSCEAPDGWFKVSNNGLSNYPFTNIDEFVAGKGAMYKMQAGATFKAHISGFDQFSIYARDKKVDTNPEKNQIFEVYIDNEKQTAQLSSSAKIRRYNITTGEHLIEIKAIGSSSSEFYGFSLRVADMPRVSRVRGNDSTQSVLQTRDIAPITYYTKYNSKGSTTLEWQGAVATGISLTQGSSDGIGDTLTIAGTALCPVGTYIYKVVAHDQNGKETNSLAGKITITSKIEATSDTLQEGFTNEAIDGFTFRYYALSGNDIALVWTSGTPAGITGSGSNGIYTIGGTPTQAGEYPFAISVLGGNTITGKLIVRTFDPGSNPVLYLYKNANAYEKDGVYQYLVAQGKNLVPRKAQDKLREKAQYDKYTWVLISEDVDANNGEIMALARGNEISMPVLNMKSFSYSESRLDWGDPDNGSINNKAVRVVQPAHPIIRALGKKQGDEIQVIDSVVGKGLMPAAVDYQGTVCLATATTRGEEYTADGKEETFLHEVPAAMRGGKKYICFPLSIQSSKRLTADGKKLIDACVDYLLSNAPSIALPTLAIQSFSIDGKAATLYQDKDSIALVMPESTELTALTPVITVADPTTHVLCKQADKNGSADFSNSNLVPVVYTVSDYINVRHYTVSVTVIQPMGVEEVYQAGEWVNIYDIQGRKVATTNGNIYTMDLPRGMYIVQTARGTIKVMR